MTSKTNKKIKEFINRELDTQIDIEKYLAEQETTEDKAAALFEIRVPITTVAEFLGLTYYGSRKIWLTLNEPRSLPRRPKTADEAREKIWPTDIVETPTEDEKPAKNSAHVSPSCQLFKQCWSLEKCIVF